MAREANGMCEQDEENKKICNFYLSLLGNRENLFADGVKIYRIILREAKLKIPELYEKIVKIMKKDLFSSLNTFKSFSQADIFSTLQIRPQLASATAQMKDAEDKDELTVAMLKMN